MFILIIGLAMGLLLIFLSLRGYSNEPGLTTGIGILFIIIGVAGFLLSEDIVTSENRKMIGLFAFSYALAAAVGAGGFIRLRHVIGARKKIKAELIGKTSAYVGRYHQYKLIFSYKYNNRSFKAKTASNVSWWTALRLKEGKTYTVRIDPKSPDLVVYGHGINILDIGIWCMVILFILVPIWVLTGFI